MNKVYLVWKCIDNPDYDFQQTTLLDIYKDKEDAIARVNKEKEDIKYDVMAVLRCAYNDTVLKIQESSYLPPNNIYALEGWYGDILVELKVKEKNIL